MMKKSEYGNGNDLIWKGSQHLTIFAAYQVSQSSALGLGMENVNMQQCKCLRSQESIATINHRLQFWQELSDQITHFQEEGGDDRILMLDSNSDFEDAGSVHLVCGHGLVDLYS